MAGSVGSDTAIDWTNDMFKIAFIGPHLNVPYTQDAATEKYWSDIYLYDIYTQTGASWGSTVIGGITTAIPIGGITLDTIEPVVDTGTSPFTFIDLVANHASKQSLPIAYPTSGYLTNGIVLTNATYAGMQGAVIYRKNATGGTNASNTWPLITYLDLCGGSISALVTTANVTPASTTINVANTAGLVASDQPIYLGDTSAFEQNFIHTIGTGTITLKNTPAHTYTLANNARILQANNALADKYTLTLAAAAVKMMGA
jgi:hypothetical protein